MNANGPLVVSIFFIGLMLGILFRGYVEKLKIRAKDFWRPKNPDELVLRCKHCDEVAARLEWNKATGLELSGTLKVACPKCSKEYGYVTAGRIGVEGLRSTIGRVPTPGPEVQNVQP